MSDYQGAVDGQSLDTLDFRDAEQLLVGEKYAAAQASADNELLGRLDAAQQALDQQEAAAEHAKATADADRQQLASTRQSLAATTTQQQQTLSQVQGQLVALVQQAQENQAAAALGGRGRQRQPGGVPEPARPGGGREPGHRLRPGPDRQAVRVRRRRTRLV